MRAAIDSRIRKLDQFFARAKGQVDEEIRYDLARFGAVLVCGFIERCVELIVLDRLSNRAQTRVLNFLKSYFRRGTTYSSGEILSLLERFEIEWGRKFETRLSEDDSLASAVDSLYSLRNSIAHGGDMYQALNGVELHYTSAKKLVEVMIEATR